MLGVLLGDFLLAKVYLSFLQLRTMTLTIGDQFRHYSGTLYTFIGHVKSIETETSDATIVSNSVIALQDNRGHIIVRPLSHLSHIMRNGKPISETTNTDGTNYYRYEKLCQTS